MSGTFGQLKPVPGKIHSVSAGIKKAVPAPVDPPAQGNLQHWFDFTDVSTLWQDVPGTIPAVNGARVLSADNKGFESDRLQQPGPAPGQEPRLLTNVVNGLSVLDSDLGSALLASTPAVNPSGVAGMTMGLVARRTDLIAASVAFFWGFGANFISALGPVPNPNWEGNALGIVSAVDSGKLIVIDEWIWAYLSLSAADNNLRVAGVAEVNNTDPYVQQPGGLGSFISFDLIRGVQFAEGLIWDKDLSPAERTGFISYVDGKYGVMPF